MIGWYKRMHVRPAWFFERASSYFRYCWDRSHLWLCIVLGFKSNWFDLQYIIMYIILLFIKCQELYSSSHWRVYLLVKHPRNNALWLSFPTRLSCILIPTGEGWCVTWFRIKQSFAHLFLVAIVFQNQLSVVVSDHHHYLSITPSHPKT